MSILEENKCAFIKHPHIGNGMCKHGSIHPDKVK